MKYSLYEIPLIQGGVRKGIILTIEGKGIGEIAPLPDWSHETFDQALLAVKEYTESGVIQTWFPPSARFGIDMALLQITHPLEEEIAFTSRSLITERSPLEKQGEIKWKIGHLSPQEAINVVKKHLHKGLLISLDINRKWTLEETLLFCHSFQPSDFLYLEDPVPHFSELELFYQKSGFPYAVDYFLLSQPLERILSLKGLSHIVIKPMLHGGHKEVETLIDRLPPSISYSLTSSLETGIGIAHIIRLRHKLKSSASLGLDTLSLHAASLLKQPLDIGEGKLTPHFYHSMEVDDRYLFS